MGIGEFISDIYLMKSGKIPSVYRAEQEKVRNRAEQSHSMKVAKANAETRKGASDEYSNTKIALLKLNGQYKKDVATAQGNDEYISDLTEDYNSQVKVLNDRLKIRKEGLAKTLISSGEYDFKESDLDNYDGYLANRDTKTKEKTKKQWIFDKTLAKMDTDGLFDYENFNTVKMESTTDKDGVKSYVYSEMDKKGEVVDTDNLGTTDNMLMTLAGGNEAEVKGFTQEKGKAKAKKTAIKENYAISQMPELGLSKSEKKEFMQATVGLSKKKKTLDDELTELEEALQKRNIPQDKIDKIIEQKISKDFEKSGSSENERMVEKVASLKAKKKSQNGFLDESDTYILKSYESMVIKKTQPDMNSMKISDMFVKENAVRFKEFLFNNPTSAFKGVENIDLANIDTSKLSSEEKALYDTHVNYLIQAEKPLAGAQIVKDALKTTASFSQIDLAVQQTISSLNRGSGINFGSKLYRDYIGNYLGFTNKDTMDALKQSNVAGAFNIFRNSLFGATVSKGEGKMFDDAVATLMQSDEKVLVGMMGMVVTMESKLRVNREALGETAFNAKFGTVSRNLITTKKMILKALKATPDGSKPKPLIDPRGKREAKEAKEATAKKESWKQYQ